MRDTFGPSAGPRSDFTGYQEWRFDHENLLGMAEHHATVLVGSHDCHMPELARICHESDWRLGLRGSGLWEVATEPDRALGKA